MTDVSSDELSAFLDLAWNNAKDGANSLPEQLGIEQQNILQLIAGGSIASLGKNSTHQAYSNYGPGSFTQRQIMGAFSTLKRYYFDAKDIITKAADEQNFALDGSFDFDVPVVDYIRKYFRLVVETPKIPDLRDLRLPMDRRHEGIFVNCP